MTVKHIVIVCTANICRSPMAAALLGRRLAEIGLDGEVEVRSAGVFAEEGQAASRGAITALDQRKISLAAHRAQPVTLALLEEADLVLVMEEAHRRSLFYLSPRHLAKVFLLAEMSGRHEDVPDPFGGPLEGYVRTAELLNKMIETGLPAILTRLGLSQAVDRPEDKTGSR